MIDSNEYLATAIRSVWLQVCGEELRSQQNVESSLPGGFRAVLERRGYYERSSTAEAEGLNI